MKIFHAYIKKYQFQPFKRLFDDSIIDVVKTELADNISTIYAIAQIPRVSYILGSFKINKKCKAVGNINIKNKILKIAIDIPATWYSAETEVGEYLRSVFPCIDDFIQHIMWQYFRLIRQAERICPYKEVAKVDLTKSNNEDLYIDCPIAKSLANNPKEYTILPIYQIINFFDINCIDSIDLLYIGKSIKSPFKRLRKHEKWGYILANYDPNYEYLVYFFEIEENKIIKTNFKDYILIERYKNELPENSIVTICEAALINFYKPTLNKEFVQSNLRDIELIRKWLLNNGYTKLVIEVQLEGVMGRLATPHKPYKPHQCIEISLL